MNRPFPTIVLLAVVAAMHLGTSAIGQEVNIRLTSDMVVNEAERGNPQAMVDEQDLIGDPPSGEPTSTWSVNSQYWKTFPYSAYIDLGEEKKLSALWLFDTNNAGELVVSVGEPGKWKEMFTHETKSYKDWTKLPLDATTRYVRFTRLTASCIFSEIALCENNPEAYQAMLAKRATEAKEAVLREAAAQKSQDEALGRPRIDLGEPFGQLALVDEIDCATESPEHQFTEDPADSSRVETILGRPCRVLGKTPGEAAYFSYRIGKGKQLRPGGSYLLTVEYPEDAPRSMIILNGGNETARGFHTGTTFGDALHPKYVNNNNESLKIPLAGKYRSWQMLFNLHDRFPDVKFIRGGGLRSLLPEDGFPVTVCQFSAENIPVSRGAAVARIRLFSVPEPARLDARVNLPPEGLPRRRLFWREEMADGVIGAEKQEERGLKTPLDWYRHKAATMRFLGMNTYCKDLLEFGACQGWDSTEGGGNQWVFFNSAHKNLWEQIVGLMGEQGFDILPYYEYSGSKGYDGLGNQRRAKPLTRDDGFTHITWIEASNADLTDPDTYDDFKKMLDLTVVRLKDKAPFVGAWLRPRLQLPMGFGDGTRSRFSTETKQKQYVTRQMLIDDKELLDRYYDWWYGKRRDFLAAMRDHLRNAGVHDATILYTADASEPGISFPTWDKQFVTDDVARWTEILKRSGVAENEKLQPIGLDSVVRGDKYLEALLAPRLNWGGWEVDHSGPPSDPIRYQQTDGLLMTHCFNRAYTVGSPKTFEQFRGPAGLAIVRHHSLNENMMFDREDEPKLGYFVCDIERAGPYCMLAEARAMAYGDPNYVGYLVGLNFNRGFPVYVRNFNSAYLALPALPSKVLSSGASDPEVVVRSIPTKDHGTYVAVVNVGLTSKKAITIRLPTEGKVTDAVTGQILDSTADGVTMSLYPCQLRALHIE